MRGTDGRGVPQPFRGTLCVSSPQYGDQRAIPLSQRFNGALGYFFPPFAALQRWARACAQTLARQKEEINRLNVFPVPDSDTGSNMAFTMASAVSALDHAVREREVKKSRSRAGNSAGIGSRPHRDDDTELTTSEAAIALAIGATKGSRGNSGVVLSQLLRGLAESAQDGPLDGASVCDALSNSLRFVQAAIVNPVEGTVITVLRSAAAAESQP